MPSTPTVVPATPTPTPLPGTPTPAGWTEQKSGDVTIWLPNDWEVLALSQGDLQAIFTEFQKSNPELAKIIGSAEALQGVALWAFRSSGADVAGTDAAFADNLNIRRSPLGGQKITEMNDVLPTIIDQYRQLGFELGATETDLQIGGHPAAHIAYSYPIVLADGTERQAERPPVPGRHADRSVGPELLGRTRQRRRDEAGFRAERGVVQGEVDG